ncbi:unnamed protein product [Fusarium venenatum]|uniref:Uncharacterized protein n=1 Tax=Fusarium venenatum TaxID=56646 RepID=A0A2L2T907_9HYPO|nr:uncharacterized protein FVRRES_03876 [Fusarium venenatum]CEI67364.1 unnamed protein product [Fusarium venenatum]
MANYKHKEREKDDPIEAYQKLFLTDPDAVLINEAFDVPVNPYVERPCFEGDHLISFDENSESGLALSRYPQ